MCTVSTNYAKPNGKAWSVPARPLLRVGGGQGRFPVRTSVDGAGSYSVAIGARLLPTELTGMWGWILLRSPHRGRGSPPAPAPTKQRPGSAFVESSLCSDVI